MARLNCQPSILVPPCPSGHPLRIWPEHFQYLGVYPFMKRAAVPTLAIAGIFVLGFWTGRSTASIWPSQSQLSKEMTQSLEFREAVIRREYAREAALRISRDPLHRYGGQPSTK